MTSDSNVDFNVLFKKSYKELGINWLDDIEKDDDYLISMMNDFESLFPRSQGYEFIHDFVEIHNSIFTICEYLSQEE